MLTHLGAFPKGREYQAGEGFPGQVLRMEFLLLVRDGEHFQVGLFVLFFSQASSCIPYVSWWEVGRKNQRLMRLPRLECLLLSLLAVLSLLVLSHQEGIFRLCGEGGGLPWSLTIKRSLDDLQAHLSLWQGYHLLCGRMDLLRMSSAARLRVGEMLGQGFFLVNGGHNTTSHCALLPIWGSQTT